MSVSMKVFGRHAMTVRRISLDDVRSTSSAASAEPVPASSSESVALYIFTMSNLTAATAKELVGGDHEGAVSVPAVLCKGRRWNCP